MSDLQKKSAEQNAPLNGSYESFSKQVDDCLQGKADRYNDLFVCSTPKVITDLGFPQLPMLYTKRHLKDAIHAKEPKGQEKHHYHGLKVRQIKRLPELLKDPVMIFRSKTEKNSVVVVTNELDSDNAPIIAAVKISGKGTYENKEQPSNFIVSVYGKDNQFLSFVHEAIKSNKMLYVDIEKSQRLLSVLQLQSSQGLSIADFNYIISYLSSFVNTQNQNSEKNKEDKPLTNDELLKALAEQLGKNNDLVGALINKINTLEEKVNETTQQLQSVTEKQEMFTTHFNQIYNAKSMEETLGIMSDLGKSDMEVESCDVYSYDALEDKLFTVDENGERVYTDISDNTPISAALLKNELFIDNNYTGGEIGDGRDTEKIHNVAVIPIEAKTGEVIGVVVAKNKAVDFDKDDVDKFNLENGKIGSAFRMGLENKALKQAAITDKLTHLHNRQGAQEHLKNVALPQIHEGNAVSTIMIDIDKFKSFNDTYGHDAGDKVLQTVAETLKSQTRSSDGVFRWGGEEMVVIANMNVNEAYELAERLRKAIENTPCDIGDGKTVQVTASMGVAQVVTEHPQQLNAANIMEYFESKPLKRADERLYEAKENGRNQVVAPPAVMKSHQQQQDRRKSSVLGSIKSAKEEENTRPKQSKDVNRDKPKKGNQDLS